LLFPELLQPEPPRPTPEVSCGEMDEPQSLLVNDWIATVIGGYVHKLLHRMPIRSFLTYVSIGDFPGVRSVPVCREELEAQMNLHRYTTQSRFSRSPNHDGNGAI
jgi:hypothetical protein